MTSARAMLTPVSEEELDRCIESAQEARRDAALQAAERRAARAAHAACATCHGNCSQGDACPARLAALHQRVAADARAADMPTSPRALLAYAAVLAAAIAASVLFPMPWGGA